MNPILLYLAKRIFFIVKRKKIKINVFYQMASLDEKIARARLVLNNENSTIQDLNRVRELLDDDSPPPPPLLVPLPRAQERERWKQNIEGLISDLLRARARALEPPAVSGKKSTPKSRRSCKKRHMKWVSRKSSSYCRKKSNRK